MGSSLLTPQTNEGFLDEVLTHHPRPNLDCYLPATQHRTEEPDTGPPGEGSFDGRPGALVFICGNPLPPLFLALKTDQEAVSAVGCFRPTKVARNLSSLTSTKPGCLPIAGRKILW